MQVELFKHTAFGKVSLGQTTDAEYARKYARMEGRRSGVHVSVEPVVTEDDVISALEDDAYVIEKMQDKAHKGADLDYYGRDGLRTDAYLTECAQRKAWTLQGHYDLEALYEVLS